MFTNKKVLLVCSPYYKDITQNLIKGAIKVLRSNSVEYKIINVPGALEIAPSIKIYSEKSSNDIPDISRAVGFGTELKAMSATLSTKDIV